MKLKEVLGKQLDSIKLSEDEYRELEEKSRNICSSLQKKIKSRRIKADVFVGGSLAKKTIMKKKNYDVDIFVRFDSKYKDSELSSLLGKLVKGEKVHGSRDYFRLKQGKVIFEIVPVVKISSPKQARNVTDLSFFHVNYVKSAIKKNKKIADEILLAKSFCYANNLYGAESYIKGFSGYALELLIINYKSLSNLMKAVIKAKNKIVLDPKKWYKNKDDILINLNEAKLSSAIVFVDPTFKERNALAALSQETYGKFKILSSKFLKKPSLAYFEEKEIDANKYNLVLKVATNKQEGDIAGSKLLKFFGFVASKLDRYFVIEKKDFQYSEGKNADYYFKVKSRKEIIFSGPKINDVENVTRFKARHKNVFIKSSSVYAKEKSKSINQFISEFKAKNKDVMKAMGILELS